MKKILAFSGSNSSESINQKLINAVVEHLSGVEVEVLNLRDYPAPVYGIDLEKEDGFPEQMQALLLKMDDADGYLVSSPEHNGSMPAVLKNTVDWLSRMGKKTFQEKPTLFLSTSPGARGGASALDHLLTIMPYRGAKIVGGYSLGSFHEHYLEGVLSEEKIKEIQPLLDKLVEAVNE